jgi:hypothetical protein
LRCARQDRFPPVTGERGRRILDAAAQAFHEKGFHELDLDRALRNHVTFAPEHRQLVGLHHREARSLADPWAGAFARRTGRYTRRWQALASQRLPGAAPELVATATQACLGMHFSVSAWPERALQTADAASVLTTLLSGGLRTLAEGPRHDRRPAVTVSARTGSPTSTRRSGGTAARRTPP